MIHPAAFSEDLILDPDENVERFNLNLKPLKSQNSNLDVENISLDSQNRNIDTENNSLDSQNRIIDDDNKYIDIDNKYINSLNIIFIKNDKIIEENNKKIEELENRKRWYESCYDLNFKPNKDTPIQSTHGSAVMEAIHLIAPQAQLLPIDKLVSKEIYGKESPTARMAAAIRKAITHKADVINISSSFEVDNDVLEACKEATRQGIAIITSAGNDSSNTWYITIKKVWDNIKELYVRSHKYDLLQKLGGKGIRFAGAVEYGSNGEEKVTSYTQHPSQDTEKQFIFAAGSQLPIHGKTNPDELVNGTSFSSPTIAGGYLLLKQNALDNGLSLTSDRILDIMHESGRDVTYKRRLFWDDKVYKSMDLDRAKKLMEGKLNLKAGAAKTALHPKNWTVE